VLCLGNCRTMWEVTDENRRLLSSWAASCDDPKRHLLADSIVKNSSPAVDFDEVNRVLREFSADYPIYQFVDGLRPFRPKSEEKRDPAYEARIERLKREQEDRIYKQMTRSVDPNQQYGRVNLMQNFAEEMRIANRQAISVANTLITVGGAFGFGFFGVGYAYPNLRADVAFRLIIGIFLATIVFFADLYFIVKSMDDPGEKPIKAAKAASVKFDMRSPSNKASDEESTNRRTKVRVSTKKHTMMREADRR
uniref:Transmembrane protein 199 n=1 Tax=Parascaris univalens TaxID=6257 RepID=A0A915B8L1_PARUN